MMAMRECGVSQVTCRFTFGLSLSQTDQNQSRSWFDKPVLSVSKRPVLSNVQGLTKNGNLFPGRYASSGA
jgi:hypothetical protein